MKLKIKKVLNRNVINEHNTFASAAEAAAKRRTDRLKRMQLRFQDSLNSNNYSFSTLCVCVWKNAIETSWNAPKWLFWRNSCCKTLFIVQCKHVYIYLKMSKRYFVLILWCETNDFIMNANNESTKMKSFCGIKKNHWSLSTQEFAYLKQWKGLVFTLARPTPFYFNCLAFWVHTSLLGFTHIHWKLL